MEREQKIDLNINPLQGGIQGWQDILELSSQQEPISDNEILDYSNLQDIRELNGLTVSGGSILETLGEVVFSPRDGVGNSTLREGLRSMTDVLNPLSITESYELQEKAIKVVNNIDSITGINHDKETTFMHLVEEFGEIARQLYNERSGRDKIDIENLKEEIADVYLLLAKLAPFYKIDLEEAINKKIKILEKRHNTKFDLKKEVK